MESRVAGPRYAVVASAALVGAGSVVATASPVSAHDFNLETSSGDIRVNYSSYHHNLYGCANRSSRVFVRYKEVRGSDVRQLSFTVSDGDCTYRAATNGYTIARVQLCDLGGCTGWKSV
jgi:hypothetical protein